LQHFHRFIDVFCSCFNFLNLIPLNREWIKDFETKLKNGDDLLNPEGAQFISDEFNEEVILGGFLERIKRVVGEK